MPLIVPLKLTSLTNIWPSQNVGGVQALTTRRSFPTVNSICRETPASSPSWLSRMRPVNVAALT